MAFIKYHGNRIFGIAPFKPRKGFIDSQMDGNLPVILLSTKILYIFVIPLVPGEPRNMEGLRLRSCFPYNIAFIISGADFITVHFSVIIITSVFAEVGYHVIAGMTLYCHPVIFMLPIFYNALVSTVVSFANQSLAAGLYLCQYRFTSFKCSITGIQTGCWDEKMLSGR